MALAPFLIMLREGLEAALIVGVIASYLQRAGLRAWLPAIWVGTFLAIALSLLVGALLQFASAEFPQKAQELFEAMIGAAAAAMLTAMAFWMRRAGHAMSSEIRRGVDEALASSHGVARALISMAFLAVAREGLESVFFLLAIFQQGAGPTAALSALAGLAVAMLLGLAIYHGGARIDLRRFFRWTGVFILVVAAGLLAGALRHLHEAGLWNLLQSRIYDLTTVLPTSSPLGALLSGVFNYQDSPTLGEAIVYGVFLATVLFLFLRPHPARSSIAAPA
ncbi:MAG: iron transporter [Rhizobiales bacterium 65-9]|nr:FTR1 family protein [Hyphomicrobiales bacterium]OJY38960.1 MAG: iron transporter [Rhizobiales bacterium 65-9]